MIGHSFQFNPTSAREGVGGSVEVGSIVGTGVNVAVDDATGVAVMADTVALGD